MSLEVKHLTHTYSAGSAFQATAVHDVSLTIEDGEFVCIVGHTGSGKSTLVQHLNGLLKPTSGQVLVDGEDMNGEGVDRRRIRQTEERDIRGVDEFLSLIRIFSLCLIDQQEFNIVSQCKSLINLESGGSFFSVNVYLWLHNRFSSRS